MDLFIRHPHLALAIGLLFSVAAAALWKRRHSHSQGAGCVVTVVPILWFAYFAWELMARKIWDIRVDLLLIYPILGLASVMALVLLLNIWRSKDQREPRK